MRAPLLCLTAAVLLSAPWPGVEAGNWELKPELTPEAQADKRLLQACDMGDAKVVDAMLVNRPKKASNPAVLDRKRPGKNHSNIVR